MLGMEHVVDRRQADVLVGAAVAGDEMRVEQFVVIIAVAVAGICQADRDIAIGEAVRNRIVRDIGEEGVVGAEAPSRQMPERRRSP